jgi:hypothetical protein
MKVYKRFLISVVGLFILALTTQSHASGGVYGNIGIYDYPWNISIGYNDYGHRYKRPHYVEHHHYYHKPKYHRGHGHYKHHKRHHHKGHYSHYRPHHSYHHDYGHEYCRH